MSKGKLLAVRLAVLALILFALTIAFPAGAEAPFDCPPGWVTSSDAASGQDHNGNGSVCVKTVPGNGNGTVPGTVVKDDLIF